MGSPSIDVCSGITRMARRLGSWSGFWRHCGVGIGPGRLFGGSVRVGSGRMRRPRPATQRTRHQGRWPPRQGILRDFNHDANPDIEPAVIAALAACKWVRKGHPLCLIGDFGTGKPHLLIALGIEAAMAGFRVHIETGTDSCRLAHTRTQQAAQI